MKTEISINGGKYHDLDKVEAGIRKIQHGPTRVAELLVEKFGTATHLPKAVALRRMMPLAMELMFLVQSTEPRGSNATLVPSDSLGAMQLENIQLKNSLRCIWQAVGRLHATTDPDEMMREMACIQEALATLPEGVIPA